MPKTQLQTLMIVSKSDNLEMDEYMIVDLKINFWRQKIFKQAYTNQET